MNTLEKTFPFVTVISERDVRPVDRNTYVVIAAKRPLDLSGVCTEYMPGQRVWYFDESDMSQVRTKSEGMILTDDYAPVENLLTPVVKKDAEEAIEKRNKEKGNKFTDKAITFARAGNLNKSLAMLEKLMHVDPRASAQGYDTVARIFENAGKLNEAMQVYRSAFEVLESAPDEQLALFHYGFGMLLQRMGNANDAEQEFQTAAKKYRDVLAKGSASATAHLQLGNILADSGNFEEAVIYFRKAVELKPNDVKNHMTLTQALWVQGKLDEAIETGNKSADYFRSIGRNAEAVKIQEYADFLRFKKSQATESAGQDNN